MSSIPTAVYLYCLVRAARRPSVARLPAGLPGAWAPEARKVSGSLWMITAEVPLAVYGSEQLEPRLRDLEWVSAAALAHEAVVEHFARARGAAVIPAKLFTMFSSGPKAIADVMRRRPAIDRAMRRIAGCEEWGLRITRNPAVAVRSTSRRRPSSGAAFLAARKETRDAAADARTHAFTAAEEAFRRLARHARAAQRRARRQEPGTNPPVLEAAFLVPAAARRRFQQEVRRQASACLAAGAELAITGPWPAYNFVGNPS